MRPTKIRSRTASTMLLVAMALATLSGCTSTTDTGTTSSAADTTSSPLTTVVTTTAAPAASTTVPPATTISPATTSAPPTSPATTAVGQVPRPVTVVTASPGGGAGEVTVDWNAVDGATGYRVDRASSATSTFETVAEFDITTGHATVAAGVVNLWSTGYTYVPATPDGSLPDRSASFQYVEYPVSDVRCYRVFAVNVAGRSPASAVVCSGPIG